MPFARGSFRPPRGKTRLKRHTRNIYVMALPRHGHHLRFHVVGRRPRRRPRRRGDDDAIRDRRDGVGISDRRTSRRVLAGVRVWRRARAPPPPSATAAMRGQRDGGRGEQRRDERGGGGVVRPIAPRASTLPPPRETVSRRTSAATTPMRTPGTRDSTAIPTWTPSSANGEVSSGTTSARRGGSPTGLPPGLRRGQRLEGGEACDRRRRQSAPGQLVSKRRPEIRYRQNCQRYHPHHPQLVCSSSSSSSSTSSSSSHSS